MSTKKQVSFRLDEKLLHLLDYMSEIYPRMGLTDIVDMALKHFLYTGITDHKFLKTEELDQILGEYMRGELDENIESLYKELKTVQAAIKKQNQNK